MRINQFPAFLGVYSIGMLGASAFVLIAKIADAAEFLMR